MRAGAAAATCGSGARPCAAAQRAHLVSPPCPPIIPPSSGSLQRIPTLLLTFAALPRSLEVRGFFWTVPSALAAPPALPHCLPAGRGCTSSLRPALPYGTAACTAAAATAACSCRLRKPPTYRSAASHCFADAPDADPPMLPPTHCSRTPLSTKTGAPTRHGSGAPLSSRARAPRPSGGGRPTQGGAASGSSSHVGGRSGGGAGAPCQGGGARTKAYGGRG